MGMYVLSGFVLSSLVIRRDLILVLYGKGLPSQAGLPPQYDERGLNPLRLTVPQQPLTG